jgi:hypothetical protein
MKIYYYKLVADNGGAPCVKNNILSLAICKPNIRKKASVGDLVFGFAGNKLNRNNPLIYVARITAKLDGQIYYTCKKYVGREDRIYNFNGDAYQRRKKAKHHFDKKDLARDLGHYPNYPRAKVLLSRDFRYFGAKSTDDYKRRFPEIQCAVERLGRGHRVKHPDKLRMELEALAGLIWRSTSKKKIGKPTSASTRGVCHSRESSDVVE